MTVRREIALTTPAQQISEGHQLCVGGGGAWEGNGAFRAADALGTATEDDWALAAHMMLATVASLNMRCTRAINPWALSGREIYIPHLPESLGCPSRGTKQVRRPR